MSTDVDEFSPEQRVMIEVMRATGRPNPEALVRADRVLAAYFGSHLAPTLERMCQVAADAIRRFQSMFPSTCPLCLMREFRLLPLRCDFCGVTAEELHRAGLKATA